MFPIIDSHCHLDFDAFSQDLPAVLERARKAGVVAMIAVGSGSDLATAQRTVALAQREPDIYAAVGIHPHDASGIDDSWWPKLEALARDPRVVGVGETGLDYFYDHSPRDAQQEVFRRFLGLSGLVQRPFICHVRDAHADAVAILRQAAPSGPGGVIHCFSGGVDDARRYLDLGLYLSFSGILTFKNADEIRSAAAYAPPHSILIETDAPYLAPVPHRGQRNEPAFVVQTLEALAAVRKVPIGALAEATAENARRLFRLPEPPAFSGSRIILPPGSLPQT